MKRFNFSGPVAMQELFILAVLVLCLAWLWHRLSGHVRELQRCIMVHESRIRQLEFFAIGLARSGQGAGGAENFTAN